jgi:antitoxin component YwqK of YwqJK toxin-antitoxin module
MLSRFCLTLAGVFLLQLVSTAQDNSQLFYEQVKDDSIKFFFTEHFRFIEKKCADYTRRVRVTNQGSFNSYFEDRSKQNTLFAKGRYVNGKKQGYFEIYYPSGKIRSKGSYVDNKPVGKWEFFYENDLPERTLNITGSDVLLEKFVDKKGNVTVLDGNGEFNGVVQGNQEGQSGIVAKGKIVNGKPDGKWTSTISEKNTYAKEEFEQGKFVRGTFPNAAAGLNRYTDRSFLNTFFLESHLSSLEKFVIEKCEDSVRYAQNDYKFDINKFRSDLRVKIDRLLEQDVRMDRIKDYASGDNNMTIQFKIDENGKAGDFMLLSGFGHQFLQTISSSIRSQTTFDSRIKTMYFHLRLSLVGGTGYQYWFTFSQERQHSF